MTANRDIRRQIPSVDRVLRHSQDLVSQWGHDRVSNGMDSSSPNRHLRAKMVSDKPTIMKMRRSPDEYYPRRC
ncbi:MAG: hypothetical protein ACJAQ8_002368 [Haliea salexigens]|jgi:hypothetical protein